MTVLDKCWKDCLRMWKWIDENWKPGLDVNNMKHAWLKSHGFRRKSLFLGSCCFFCEYHENHGDDMIKYRGNLNCKNCPGVYVSKAFSCLGTRYSFQKNPKAFYRTILALNKKRRQN